MVRGLIDRARYVVNGEDGASNIEIIIWISVVLVIATALFVFRDKIADFLGSASGEIEKMDQNIKGRVR
ncbi:hypothetical protein NDS46_30785 (plasmid) [Paenibacillus thiaminolyticus]|uniref:hypothetical protein n=1 Tax=Paenibacillus thiaminolyticus TaxID=49283 RepID=UPI00232C8EAE|nr:hypothetical protein [Paenibacillus thiaminolyticus]WCF11733.1 hypothetical protein NDS46_30785 [Paenibacillus thiaminolyticus]